MEVTKQDSQYIRINIIPPNSTEGFVMDCFVRNHAQRRLLDYLQEVIAEGEKVVLARMEREGKL